MERKQHKALNFDLDTKALEQHYPTAHFRQAYRDIARFLEASGFEHRQWSGYRSLKAMSDAEITLVITRLNARFPWLSKCVSHFDVTNIGRNYDLTALFSEPVQVPELPESPQAPIVQPHLEETGPEQQRPRPKRKRARER